MGQCWDHVEYVKWTAVPFWAMWESESKSVKGDWSPSRGAALWRRGSRQKHIIEGRSSVNEGSMHRSPQLLTPPWVTAKTLYIVLTTFSTLEYEFSIFLGRGTRYFSSCWFLLFYFQKCSQLILSVTHQPTFDSLFWPCETFSTAPSQGSFGIWEPDFTHTTPTGTCLQVSL